MAEPGAGCNARSGAERIRDDLDPALGVDQSHVEAHRTVLPGGFCGDILGGCRKDAPRLTVRHPFGGDGMRLGALDLDEDQLRAIPQDQVDLTRRAAPPPRRDGQPRAQIGGLDLILGRDTAVIGNGTLQPFAVSFSAIW